MLKPVRVIGRLEDDQKQGSVIIESWSGSRYSRVMMRIGDFYYDTLDIIKELKHLGFEPQWTEDREKEEECN